MENQWLAFPSFEYLCATSAFRLDGTVIANRALGHADSVTSILGIRVVFAAAVLFRQPGSIFGASILAFEMIRPATSTV